MSYRCAACTNFRRKCQEDCIFAPYFPSEEQEKFDLLHKYFGGRNIAKVLQDLEVNQRATAISTMYFEAQARNADPVQGCTKIINELRKQVYDTQAELERTRATIALCANLAGMAGNQPQPPSNASGNSKNHS